MFEPVIKTRHDGQTVYQIDSLGKACSAIFFGHDGSTLSAEDQQEAQCWFESDFPRGL